MTEESFVDGALTLRLYDPNLPGLPYDPKRDIAPISMALSHRRVTT